MKPIICLILTITLLSSCEKNLHLSSSFYDCRFEFADSSARNPQHVRYQSFLNSLTASGVTGVDMAVYHPGTGMWIGASGKADLHNQVDMKPCTITRVGSTVKMYTAVVCLQLQEEGKLDLDDKISDYLSGDRITRIENAGTATIRQLLQHSAGIHNYIRNLQFQTASLNDLVRVWKPDDLLQYSYNQKAFFSPGEDVNYSNTGYILLGLLIEKIENKPLHQVFDEKIIRPLGLRFTQFAGKNPVPDGIARGYVDIYSKLQVTESTYYSGWDYYTADGGLISNAYDMNEFFRALMSGRLINNNSLSQMLSWQAPRDMPTDFFPIAYGLGIFKIDTPAGIAYIHSGDAIGYYCHMFYFPADGTTIVYATNCNYGKIDRLISSKEAMEKIINVTR